MIKVLALTFALAFAAYAQPPTPKDMYEFAAPMTFMCVDSLTRMIEILKTDYQEIPMVMSHLTPSMTLILFVNRNSTTSTVVVTKRKKDKDQSCIVFGGSSNGTSYSVNPNPVFPIEKGIEG